MTLRAIMAALVAVLVFITGPPDIIPARVLDPRSVVLEDDPRWDCRTDGNRICGSGNAYPLGDYSRAGKGRLGTLGTKRPAIPATTYRPTVLYPVALGDPVHISPSTTYNVAAGSDIP